MQGGSQGDGGGSAGSGQTANLAWKPSMTRAEADEFRKDSKFKEDVYHGTLSGDMIKDTGFVPSRDGNFGAGIYGSTQKAQSEVWGEPLTLAVDMRKPGRFTSETFNYKMTTHAIKFSDKNKTSLTAGLHDFHRQIRVKFDGLIITRETDKFVIPFAAKQVTVISN
jgi:hypothetical protein